VDVQQKKHEFSGKNQAHSEGQRQLNDSTPKPEPITKNPKLKCSKSTHITRISAGSSSTLFGEQLKSSSGKTSTDVKKQTCAILSSRISSQPLGYLLGSSRNALHCVLIYVTHGADILISAHGSLIVRKMSAFQSIARNRDESEDFIEVLRHLCRLYPRCVLVIVSESFFQAGKTVREIEIEAGSTTFASTILWISYYPRFLRVFQNVK